MTTTDNWVLLAAVIVAAVMLIRIADRLDNILAVLDGWAKLHDLWGSLKDKADGERDDEVRRLMDRAAGLPSSQERR